TCAISPTMRPSVAGLIPNASSPIRASPLSFSSTRLNFSEAATSGCFLWLVFILLRLVDLRHHLGCEIAGLLLDALADDVQDEPRHRGLPRLQQASTDCLSFFTKGCPSSVTSLRNFCTLPSTIFATMSAGLPDSAAFA